MSPSDLCTIDFIDVLLDAGVEILKIEGRGRSPEYVRTVVNAYREAVEAIYAKTYTEEKKQNWKTELSSVYNRGFWEGGYYLGKKLGEWSKGPGSKATEQRASLGKVTNYFSQIGVAEILLESGDIPIGKKILISGPTTGAVFCKVDSLRTDREVTFAQKGETVAIAVPEKVRKSDKVYLMVDNPLRQI